MLRVLLQGGQAAARQRPCAPCAGRRAHFCAPAARGHERVPRVDRRGGAARRPDSRGGARSRGCLLEEVGDLLLWTRKGRPGGAHSSWPRDARAADRRRRNTAARRCRHRKRIAADTAPNSLNAATASFNNRALEASHRSRSVSQRRRDYISPLGQSEDVGLCSVLRRRGFDDINVVPVQRGEGWSPAASRTPISTLASSARPPRVRWFVRGSATRSMRAHAPASACRGGAQRGRLACAGGARRRARRRRGRARASARGLGRSARRTYRRPTAAPARRAARWRTPTTTTWAPFSTASRTRRSPHGNRRQRGGGRRRRRTHESAGAPDAVPRARRRIVRACRVRELQGAEWRRHRRRRRRHPGGGGAPRWCAAAHARERAAPINEAWTTLPTGSRYGSEAVVDRWLAEWSWTEAAWRASAAQLLG